MPKVAGLYVGIVRLKREVSKGQAESKQEAIRDMLLYLAGQEDQSDFEDWVKGGMEIELVKS